MSADYNECCICERENNDRASDDSNSYNCASDDNDSYNWVIDGDNKSHQQTNATPIYTYNNNYL